MSFRPPLPSLLAPVLLSLAACAATDDEEQRARDVKYLISQGQYEEAVRVADALARENPSDAAALATHRRVSVAYLLEEGRRRTFLDDDDDALYLFELARSMEPDAGEVHEWIAKTRAKLSLAWGHAAREMHAEDQLRNAQEAYQRALHYGPDNEDSRAGLEHVGIQLAYRDELSEDYYYDGIENLREYRLHIAKSRFGYSTKYRLDDERPVRRIREVDRELSKRFAARARKFEAEEFYAAARTEFRIAHELDAKHAEATDGYARMTVEAQANEKLKSGKMWLRRKEWDKAREVLQEGLDLTAVQQQKFHDAMVSIDDDRAAHMYRQALNLEHDFRYDEAVLVYGQILTEREFYEDTLARMKVLSEAIVQAEEIYGRLAATTTPEERLLLLRQIDLVWPEYKDIQVQMDELAPDGVER